MILQRIDPESPMPRDNPGGLIAMYEDGISPEELAAFHAQREKYERNRSWLLPRLHEIHARHKGNCICVAAEELFVAETPEEAIALASAAHPEDDGRLLRYLSPVKGPRIYARQRHLAAGQ